VLRYTNRFKAIVSGWDGGVYALRLPGDAKVSWQAGERMARSVAPTTL